MPKAEVHYVKGVRGIPGLSCPCKGSFINYVTPFWPKMDPLPPPPL